MTLRLVFVIALAVSSALGKGHTSHGHSGHSSGGHSSMGHSSGTGWTSGHSSSNTGWSGHSSGGNTGWSGHSSGGNTAWNGHSSGGNNAWNGHSSGNTGHSGQSASYPESHGLSGNKPAVSHNTHTTTNNNYHKTEVHHHYTYTQPQQIHYGSTYHPVYHGTPPVVVYQYRESGSRYSDLLAGLALYNLGRWSASQSHYRYTPHEEYRSVPGEVCKFQITKANGEYEETRIQCSLMSTFIWDAQQEQQPTGQQTNVQSTNTVSVTKTETVDASNNTVIVTKVENTTNALEVKGPAIQVTPEMSCYMVRIARDTSIIKRKVDCGLLQTYARNSFRSAAWQSAPYPLIIILLKVILYLMQ